MEIKSGKDVNVEVMNDEIVTFTKMNHISEIQYLSAVNTKARTRKLNAEEYVDLRTGEIKQFELSETRADNVNSLKKTFKKLRYLINNNFVGNPNEFFITLTFSPDESGWRPSVSEVWGRPFQRVRFYVCMTKNEWEKLNRISNRRLSVQGTTTPLKRQC